jgi:hypothetical protein
MESTTSNPMHGLTPLIDADILVYRCGFAADSQVKRDILEASGGMPDEDLKEILNETDYVNFALGNVKTVMQDFLDRFGVKDDSYKAYLTGSGNFRDQLATILPYKGNRDELHKPKYYSEIKQYLVDVWGSTVISGREADDALGCEQWANKSRGTCIVTIDKDLDQIPGYHYSWVKQEFYDQPLEDANKFIFYQMLTGDRVDNIPGIKGVGSKTAEKLLGGLALEDARELVRARYRTQYANEWERAYYEVGNLLWIQRIEGKECPYL